MFGTAAVEATRRTAGGSEGRSHQGVGDEQAEGTWGAKPTPEGAEPQVQPTVGAAAEAHGTVECGPQHPRGHQAQLSPASQQHWLHQVYICNSISVCSCLVNVTVVFWEFLALSVDDWGKCLQVR